MGMSEVLEEIRKVFGNDPFTADDLIKSQAPVSLMWHGVAYAVARSARGISGVSVVRSVGKHLAATSGIESMGRNRNGAHVWRIKP